MQSIWDRRVLTSHGGQTEYLVSFTSSPRKKKWVNSKELNHAQEEVNKYDRRYPIAQTRLRSGSSKGGKRARRAITVT